MAKLFARLLVLSLAVAVTVFAQDSASWHDPSKHTVQFVTVEEDVRLEVLDWGGSGRPVVLLAGSGNTAHVFDDFAEELSRVAVTSTASLDAGSALRLIPIRVTTNSDWPTTCSRSSTR